MLLVAYLGSLYRSGDASDADDDAEAFGQASGRDSFTFSPVDDLTSSPRAN